MFNILSQKRCSKCGETKPISEFHKDKHSRDGRQGRCKSCSSSRVRWSVWQEEKRRVGMKYCSACGEWKNASDFHKRVASKDGLNKKCKDCARRQAKEWASSNKQSVAERVKLWQANNREKSNAQKSKSYKKWTLNHRSKYLASKTVRRARERAGDGSVTAQEWEALKKFYNYTCLCCKRREPEIKLTLDHVKPLFVGGSNTIDNVQPLCGSCNSSKSTKWIDYR